MGCLGVHFSLSENEVAALRGVDESDRPDYVREVIEESYFADHPDRVAESDKAWDAIHRVLADGELSWTGGEYPLNHLILGGELLYTESDFILVLKSPDQVKDVANALPRVTEKEFRRRYFAINPKSYGFPTSEEDFSYTWDWFQQISEFWLKVAKENRCIIFTASQ